MGFTIEHNTLVNVSCGSEITTFSPRPLVSGGELADAPRCRRDQLGEVKPDPRRDIQIPVDVVDGVSRQRSGLRWTSTCQTYRV